MHSPKWGDGPTVGHAGPQLVAKKLIRKFCTKNAIVLGMTDNGHVENIAKQGLKINDTIQKAEVHVIVGSFHRRHGAFHRYLFTWDGKLRGTKR